MFALIVHKRSWGTAKGQSPYLHRESICVPALRIRGDDLMNSPCGSTWAPGRATSVQGTVIFRECADGTLPTKILLDSDPVLSWYFCLLILAGLAFVVVSSIS